MDAILNLLSFLSPLLLLAEVAPRGHALLSVLLPRFHILLNDLFSRRLLLSFMPFLPLVGGVEPFKVVLSLLDLLKQLLAHVLDLKVEGFLR